MHVDYVWMSDINLGPFELKITSVITCAVWNSFTKSDLVFDLEASA